MRYCIFEHLTLFAASNSLNRALLFGGVAMAHGRVWIGVGVLLIVAGTAAAQPVYSGAGAGPSGPVTPAFLPGTPPAPTLTPPSSSIQTIAAISDELPHAKEIPSGLPELIPPPDKHG